jgi:putative protein-disulfide isomerase
MTDDSPTPDASRIKNLIYFADPMCSWCYGFSPVIGALSRQFGERLPIRLVMGGLRAGNTQAMREKDKEYIRGAWANVGEASGQPFDEAFFEREGFVYDTEPACRAVVTMRRLERPKALPYLARISRAFYAQNQDVTQPEVLAALAAEFGFEPDIFHLDLVSPESRNETMRDFLVCQQSGVQGYPLLVAGTDAEGYQVVTHGYQPLDGMPEALEQWLAAG